MRPIRFVLLCAFIALSVTSCQHCKKCVPTLKIQYVVPEFACPFPGEPAIKELTPEIVADEALKMKTLKDNIVILTQTETAWRVMYKTCIDNIIKAYSTETTGTNTYNSTVADPVEDPVNP